MAASSPSRGPWTSPPTPTGLLLNQAYTSTIENEKGILKGFDSLMESAQRTLETLDHPLTTEMTPTLVYRRDEDGDHSFGTDRLRLA